MSFVAYYAFCEYDMCGPGLCYLPALCLIKHRKPLIGHRDVFSTPNRLEVFGVSPISELVSLHDTESDLSAKMLRAIRLFVT